MVLYYGAEAIPMGLLKRTYALPEEVLRPFEAVVGKGKRSTLLTGLIRDWIEEQHLKKLRKGIVSGCREMSAEYLEQESSYHPFEEEAGRGL
jgi:hypothetical protein